MPATNHTYTIGTNSINLNPATINVTPASSSISTYSLYVGASSVGATWNYGVWDPDPEPQRKLSPPFQLTIDNSDLSLLTSEEIHKKFLDKLVLYEEKKAEQAFYKDLQAWRVRNNWKPFQP